MEKIDKKEFALTFIGIAILFSFILFGFGSCVQEQRKVTKARQEATDAFVDHWVGAKCNINDVPVLVTKVTSYFNNPEGLLLFQTGETKLFELTLLEECDFSNTAEVKNAR